MGDPVSFGLVSLVGDGQAVKVDGILRQRLEPAEYRRRQILCGDSAQFQGDERDVMFLSVVDSPPGKPPLPMRQEGPKKIFKKRFNVAASRARDQMWVVHSLNHEIDLQPGDYRRRLVPRSGSFEGSVLRRLRQRGYHVVPQFPAGACHIDLVVVGNGRRLAIKCDGEQYQGAEKVQEEIERQAVLERLGWTFARIRASLFFRDEERALERVFRRLEELDIPPEPAAVTPAPDPARAEVVERVIRRAEELRASWRANHERRASTTQTPGNAPAGGSTARAARRASSERRVLKRV